MSDTTQLFNAWLTALDNGVWPAAVPRPPTTARKFGDGASSPHSAIVGARTILKALLEAINAD